MVNCTNDQLDTVKKTFLNLLKYWFLIINNYLKFVLSVSYFLILVDIIPFFFKRCLIKLSKILPSFKVISIFCSHIIKLVYGNACTWMVTMF